jgi:hypothetical protein
LLHHRRKSGTSFIESALPHGLGCPTKFRRDARCLRLAEYRRYQERQEERDLV